MIDVIYNVKCWEHINGIKDKNELMLDSSYNSQLSCDTVIVIIIFFMFDQDLRFFGFISRTATDLMLHRFLAFVLRKLHSHDNNLIAR